MKKYLYILLTITMFGNVNAQFFNNKNGIFIDNQEEEILYVEQDEDNPGTGDIEDIDPAPIDDYLHVLLLAGMLIVVCNRNKIRQII